MALDHWTAPKAIANTRSLATGPPPLNLIQSENVIVIVDLWCEKSTSANLEPVEIQLRKTSGHSSYRLQGLDAIPFGIVDEGRIPDAEPRPVGLVGLQQVRQRRGADLGGGNHLLVVSEVDELVVQTRHGLQGETRSANGRRVGHGLKQEKK